MRCHFHATAGVGAAQDEVVIAVLSLAAGVPESQGCDGALQSLVQGRRVPLGGPAPPQSSLPLPKHSENCPLGLESWLRG